LILMAKAGYDPQEAPRFWERFASSHPAEQPPEFLSTHPNDARRAEDLRKMLVEATQLYEASANKYGMGERLVIATPPTGVVPAGAAPGSQQFVPAFAPRGPSTAGAYAPAGRPY